MAVVQLLLPALPLYLRSPGDPGLFLRVLGVIPLGETQPVLEPSLRAEVTRVTAKQAATPQAAACGVRI